MSLSPQPAETADKGRHYEFIKSAVNDNFKTATVSRGKALAATPLKIESWYTSAPAAYLDRLSNANLKAWSSQNQVDHLLAKTDLYTFAEPLLKAKIKERHGIEPDLKNTFLRLYLPKDKPWYAVDVSAGVVTRTVSLLDAALHNFASGETVGHGSDYISNPDERGLFDVLPIKNKMPISQFQTLCRDLDIGAQYQKHLQSYLLPGEPVAESVLQYKVNESQKDALAVATHLALIKEDIQYDAYKMLLNLAEDKPLLLNGRSMYCCDLSMLDTRLTGVLLLMHRTRDNRGVRRLIVYVPHDPDHPLKEYSSLKAFKTELARQLREDAFCASTEQTFRQFFSQFVDQQQRGHFFATLEQRLFVVRYHPREDPTDQQPAWRKDPVENPNLQMQQLPLQGNYWQHAYQQKLNKMLNDAREIAVSTADTDSKARWAWWDNFKKIVSDIFNVALLIATPFVPGLGELMMAYTAYQLTSDVIEGIVDLAEGVWEEAAGHVISVVTDIIQLAAFAAGAQIGEAFRVKLSQLVDAMKPVKLPNGKDSLWHPDLSPYERNDLILSPNSKPDRLGLQQHGNESILPLEGKLYNVEKASTAATSNTHRIKHPKRANAYKPQVEHNGHGAWVHEAETPHDWPDEALMRRLGHSVERFSPTELEQIRISSGTDHNALRQMHIDNSPPPPLLADSVKRFGAYDDANSASSNIRRGQPIDPQAVWLEPILTGLPGWPSAKSLEVYADASLTGYSRKYGNPHASPADTLTIGLDDLNAGRLPEQVVSFLSDGELNNLLGNDVAPDQRVSALRGQLADAVEERRSAVASHLYQGSQRSAKADVSVVRQTFPDLPLPLAEKLVTQASPAELQRIADDHRLPLRLKAQARELDFEARAARAYEGFYRDELMTVDTERLTLNTLKFHTASFADLRIEVRSGSPDGPLRCAAGSDKAPIVRRLVRDEQGRYEVIDANGRTLHNADDFYESILRAMPEQTLADTGYRRGQGRVLKNWIMETAAPAAERRTVLAEPPIRPVVPLETETLVRGWPRWFFAGPPEERVKALFPGLNETQVTSFIKDLSTKGDPVEAIKRLEVEREQFRNALQKWRESYPAGVDASGEPIHGTSGEYLHNGGLYLEEQLVNCFERKSRFFKAHNDAPAQGYTLDLSSELLSRNLERWWKDLRERPEFKPFIDQITALKLGKTEVSSAPDGLLGSFPHLRQLRVNQGGLREIPSTIGGMKQLEHLDLADNSINLNPDSIRQLSELTQLHTLNLNGNPLNQPPDIGRMYRLRDLSLANTRLKSWPQGLFKVGAVNRQRPRTFRIDLRKSPINSVPDVPVRSDQAFVLARARFDQSKLPQRDLLRLGYQRKLVGFSFEQRYTTAGNDEISHWRLLPEDAAGLGPSAELSPYREESWHDVQGEPGSADLFKVIAQQRNTADYQLDQPRRRLTARVWELIDAVALDTDLREALFKQAREPESCYEGGAYLFNSMGVKVLVAKAYAEPTSARELDHNLLTLARSSARLESVGDMAREEISRQTQRNLIDPRNNRAPDDLQVHMAYQSGLAERLGLPWQSEKLLYRQRAGVSPESLDEAYTLIIKREDGDGLVNKMIAPLDGNDFWEQHLRKTHPTQYETHDRLFQVRHERLEDLRAAQEQWANLTDPARLNPLARKMEVLADQLDIPQVEVFSGDPMDPQLYDRLMEKMGYERMELSRKLTREALVRAGF
jgi:hypothetical protein